MGVMHVFRDRVEAGRILAQRLEQYRAEKPVGDPAGEGNRYLHSVAGGAVTRAVVLGIPRGGVEVAAEVAQALGLELDVVVAAKVGAPGNPEFAVGAVAADGEVHVNPAAALPAEEVRRLSGPAHAKVTRALGLFRAGRGPLDLEGRVAIVVDDGLATGLTALAAVGYLRRLGAERVVLAVPVTPRDTAQMLAGYVDELVVLETPAYFSAVGQFYRSFGQVEDDEVVELLAAARQRTIG